MLKSALLKISLSLLFIFVFVGSGCETIPAFPEVFQCGVYNFQLLCVNNKTGEERVYNIGDPEIKGAQCLLPEDYKKSEEYITELKRLARRHCGNNRS